MRAWMGWLAIGCLLAASLGGCNRPGGNPAAARQGPNVVGAVAVIDLELVAKQLGRDTQMTESMRQRGATLNQQLAAIKVSYEKEISERRSQLGQNPSQEQAQQLSNLNQQANAQFGRVRKQADADLTQHRLELIQRFRDEVKPIARQAASEKGLSIIVTRNETVVFDFAPAVDITEEVIRRMRDRQPPPPAAPATITPPAASPIPR